MVQYPIHGYGYRYMNGMYLYRLRQSCWRNSVHQRFPFQPPVTQSIWGARWKALLLGKSAKTGPCSVTARNRFKNWRNSARKKRKKNSLMSFRTQTTWVHGPFSSGLSRFMAFRKGMGLYAPHLLLARIAHSNVTIFSTGGTYVRVRFRPMKKS